ncbi:tyrosine-type recombinase/integrase [bacterium]|nr:tyrosine-type recombinase/integrase [bacterium]
MQITKISNGVQEYKKYLKTLELEPSTLKGYLWHINKFLDWLGEEELSEAKLKKYFQYLLKRYKKVSTINLRLIILNNYLKFLNKKFRFDLLSDEKSPMRILRQDQLQQFLDKASKNKKLPGLRDKALLELLYSTGIKVGQLIKLRLDQIDEIKKELIINKDTHIQISSLAWFHLKKYIDKRADDQPWLFINFDRSNKSAERNLSVRSVERIIAKYAKGMNPPLIINPQILRNSLAYQLKKQGARHQEIGEALHFKTSMAAEKYFNRI